MTHPSFRAGFVGCLVWAVQKVCLAWGPVVHAS